VQKKNFKIEDAIFFVSLFSSPFSFPFFCFLFIYYRRAMRHKKAPSSQAQAKL